MLPSCLLCHGLSSLNLLIRGPESIHLLFSRWFWGNLSCSHLGVCTVRKGPKQLDYLGLDLSSDVT